MNELDILLKEYDEEIEKRFHLKPKKKWKTEREELIEYLENKIKNLSTITTFCFEINNKVTSIAEIQEKVYQEILDKILKK